MTLMELMTGNLRTSQGASLFGTSAQSFPRCDDHSDLPGFEQILNNSMSSVDRENNIRRNEYSVKAASNYKTATDKADNRTGYLTFREAQIGGRKISDAASAEKSCAKSTEREDTPSAEATDKPHGDNDADVPDMIHILAQLFGLDAADLQKLAIQEGLPAEVIDGAMDAGAAAAALTKLFGLNEEQQQTLEGLLKTVSEIFSSTQANTAVIADEDVPEYMEAAVLKKNAEDAAGSSETARGGGNTSAALNATGAEALYDELRSQILEKLEKYSGRLDTGNTDVRQELEKLMQPLLERLGAKEQAQEIQPENGAAGQLTASADTDKSIEAGEAGSDSGEGKQDTGAATDRQTFVRQSSDKLNETPSQSVFSTMIHTEKPVEASMTAAAAKSAPAREIIGQIIDKARVVLTQDRSEMVLDLKPDSLGKITMKVVTENGIVMAKFIAENQQVREVLESNMQLLKDSLEKQGMNVQGFSVSVRQDADRPGYNDRRYGRNYAIHKGSKGALSGQEGNLPDFASAAAGSDPYYWGSSTINLTA